MTGLEYILQLRAIPMSVEKPCTVPSKSEIRRWLKQKAIHVNGEPLDADKEVNFPIHTLVFFPNGKRKTSM